MNTQIFSQILGPTIFIISIITVLQSQNSDETRKSIEDHASMQLTASLVPLMIGVIILCSIKSISNTTDHLVYGLGMLFLISGLFRLFFTSSWIQLIKKVGNTLYTKSLGSAMILYSAILTYYGFINF